MDRANLKLLVAAVLYTPAAVVFASLPAVLDGGYATPDHLALTTYVAPIISTLFVVRAKLAGDKLFWSGVVGFAGWVFLVGQAWRSFMLSMWGSC